MYSGGVSSFKPSTDPKTSKFFRSRTLDFGQFLMDFLGSKNNPAFFWSKAHSFGVSVGAGNQGTEWWNDGGFNGFGKFTWDDDPRKQLICIFVSFLHQEWNGTFCCDIMWLDKNERIDFYTSVFDPVVIV